MPTLNWTPQQITRVPTYPGASGSPSAMRVFRRLDRARSEPHHEVWEASSEMANESERSEIESMFESTMFGAGSFQWTPPGKTEGTYRFVGGTLRVTQARAVRRYAISVQIEKV